MIPNEQTELSAAPDESLPLCAACAEPAGHTCQRCQAQLCAAHSYADENSEKHYCRACADDIVGVCAICDALYARPCHTCGRKVCEAHATRHIERWGWGGLPGQGGVTTWFPVRRTYCPEHGAGRTDAPRPKLRTMKGYDGSSPEW